MKKITVFLALAVLILVPSFSAFAEGVPVNVIKTLKSLPEEAPVWEMDYEYPHLEGEDVTAMLINDYYSEAANEMTALILPMLAGTPEAHGASLRQMTQRFRVTCNNGRFFSVLFMTENRVNGESFLSLDSDTFDISGEYAGQILTLRGVVMVGESSAQLSSCLMPVLYERFADLQEQGIADPELTEEDFYDIVFPESHFFANEDGSVTFYFQPDVLEEPTFEVPCFTFTPKELESLINTQPEDN